MGTISPTPSELERTILFDEDAQAIDHVLSELLRMNTETIDKVKLWFAYNNVRSMSHLIDLYLDSPEHIKSPEYRVGSVKEYLDKWSGVSLTLICKLGEYLITQNRSMLDNQDWLRISKTDFDEFRISTMTNPPSPIPATPTRTPGSVAFSSPGGAPSQSPSQFLLATLRRTVKLDVAAFPKLQDNKHIEPFWRSFQAVAKYQGMSHILDPKFKPDPTEPGSSELFDFQNQFMYSVVLTTFLTDTAKMFVREHSTDMDAQKVVAKLIQYTKDSPRTTMEINRLTKYITGIKLDANWRGTTEQFL